ncbi:MAG: GNAT family N-acetyltransferase [Clostridia bacterium]|nr:GNAT family N-acetyltransferase [Clostridia bacterium]
MSNGIPGLAVKEDLPEIRLLWQEAFGDSTEYIDRFISTLDITRDIFVMRVDGTVRAMHCAVPVYLRCGDILEKGVYFYSCCTKKEFRGMGLLRELMSFSHEELARRGERFAVVTPARPGLFPMYLSFGFSLPAYGTPGLVGSPDRPLSENERDAFLALSREPFDGDTDLLYSLYRRAVGRDRAAFVATREFFPLTIDGYSVDYVTAGGRRVGFAVYETDINKNDIIVHSFYTDRNDNYGIIEGNIGETVLKDRLENREPKALYRVFGEDIPVKEPRLDLFAER